MYKYIVVLRVQLGLSRCSCLDVGFKTRRDAAEWKMDTIRGTTGLTLATCLTQVFFDSGEYFGNNYGDP